MKFYPIAVAGLCAAMLSPLVAQAAAPQPNTGFYRVDAYTDSATPENVCAGLNRKAGLSVEGTYYYPGPLATGAVARFTDATAGAVLAGVYPKTPAAGATLWKGVLSFGVEPSGPYLKVPFSRVLTYLSKSSFSAVQTSKIKIGVDTCTLVENLVFTQTGS